MFRLPWVGALNRTTVCPSWGDPPESDCHSPMGYVPAPIWTPFAVKDCRIAVVEVFEFSGRLGSSGAGETWAPSPVR